MTVLGLVQAVRRRWLLVCLFVVLTEVLVAQATRGRAGWDGDQYISTGKLLMRPTARSATVTSLGMALEVTPTRSRATELWFLDFRRARQIVEGTPFLERVKRRLPAPQNETPLAELRTQLLVFPSSLQLDTLSSLHETAQIEGEEELEADLEVQGLQDIVGRRRLRVITLSATSTNAVDAQRLARVALYEFMDEARRIASGDYTLRREVLGGMLKNAERQADRVDRRLRAEQTDPLFEAWTTNFNLQQEKGRATVLSSEISQQRLLLADAQRHLTGAQVPPVGEDPLSVEILEAERQLKVDEEVFSSTSASLAETRARLFTLLKLRTDNARVLYRGRVSQLESQVRLNEERLQSQKAEILRLTKEAGTEQEHRQVYRLAREAEQWQETIAGLIKKFYQVRVEERQALAAGTLVLMEKPQLGTRVSDPGADFNMPAALVALFPVGIFLGIVAAGSIQVFWQHRSPIQRLPRELGLPLLVALPTLPAERSREWQNMKRSKSERGNS